MADKPQRYIILTDPGEPAHKDDAPQCREIQVLRRNWLRLGRPATIKAYFAAAARQTAPAKGGWYR